MDNILKAAGEQSILEWTAVITSIIYVILAAKESIWCWFFGIIGVICSLIVYFQSKFYLDASLQVYYFFVSIYGWWNWGRSNKNELLLISTRKKPWHLQILVLGLIIAYPLGLLSQYFGGALPFIDALTTSFSLLATYMVAKKILENWLYWIVIDLICVWAYWTKELYLFAFLFLIYSIVAVFGWLAWKKKTPIQV